MLGVVDAVAAVVVVVEFSHRGKARNSDGRTGHDPYHLPGTT